MKSIRSKLIIYFFVFVVLFNIVAVSIYVSSNTLTKEYHESFKRFLIYNSISQASNTLYEDTKAYVMEKDIENFQSYYGSLSYLRSEEAKLRGTIRNDEQIQMKTYINLIESLLRESELTVGFMLQDNIEQYTSHLEETQNTASYIQDTTLHLIDLELTEYQALYQDLKERNDSFRMFILFLFITTVLLGIFFAIWFAYGINRPLQTLSKAAKEVSEGDFEGEPVVIDSKDELKLLGDSFNQMRTSIHGLIEEIKDKSELDRLMKELELKHLQNQVNPHFLFNTLNTISKMAYLENAASTSNLIDSVSTLLRYSLSDIEKSVALRDEVKVAQEYLTIQKTRFQERIKLEIDLDESCLDVLVPRLTLQPIVENAFIHGVEELEEGGTIKLFVYQESQQIVVEVTDNGVGMSREQVNRILSFSKVNDEEEHVGHSTGLGLNNVIRRLQLY